MRITRIESFKIANYEHRDSEMANNSLALRCIRKTAGELMDNVLAPSALADAMGKMMNNSLEHSTLAKTATEVIDNRRLEIAPSECTGYGLPKAGSSHRWMTLLLEQ